jgi:hypothetical protein
MFPFLVAARFAWALVLPASRRTCPVAGEKRRLDRRKLPKIVPPSQCADRQVFPKAPSWRRDIEADMLALPHLEMEGRSS